MNERIRELAKQHFVRIEFERGGVHECYEFSMEELEQFVVLIVQECTKILEEDDGATPNGELLFEHFGVEE